ncbi:serine-protein kinase ATM [Manduca sexta]|uniref:Serine/threonine-protein kinase ATM n=1 Tax=Manduca sexta TaxID=7130 RepID=A0A922CRS2_MANSE|nr:serine-protein kinase ATM [Manduca sexta]KAG6455766.1 hypothetical protein O3G_MSEX009399 [Manduca sexta]
MALEVSLKEICDGLKSNRITDRKKNAEALKEYLLRNAVPMLLTENTFKKNGYTWTQLFVDINDYILKETEKYDTSKTFDTVTGPLCTSLLHLCVAGSNKGGAYVKCNTVIEACLYILKDKRLLKAIGDAYLILLYKHILPHDYYLGYIAPSTWEEILDISLSVCKHNYSKLDDYTKLRLLLLIVKSGSNNCQIIIYLRNSLSTFENCFLKLSYDKKVQEVIVEIIILLLETLSTECRLTMCRFTEKMLSCVLKFYDQNMDQNKKVSLFKLLHGTVILHHPLGRIQTEEGSLAHDWEIWNRRLNGILEIICLEVTYLQKFHKQNNNSSKDSSYFYSLAASVYYQIFNQLRAQTNEAEESFSKRQKTTHNKTRTFVDLIEEFKLNHNPWIGVIQMLVKNQGQCITFEEYLMLLNVLDTLALNSKTGSTWDIFGELTCSVLEKLMSNNLFKKEDHVNVVTSLWDSCVRNSTCLNAGHKSLHKIMQCLLLLDAVTYQTAETLIKLYVEKSMPVSDSSVKTLSMLMYKFFNKCSNLEFRINCFVWFSQDIKAINPESTVELILRVLANENISNVPECQQTNDINLTYKTLFNSIEKCILFSEFEYEIPKVVPVTAKKEEHIEINADIENKTRDIIFSQLTDYIKKLENNNDDLLGYIKFVNIVLLYLNTVITHSCKSPKEIKKIKLYNLLDTALKKMYASLKKVLESNVQIPIKIKILESTKGILETDFHRFLNAEVRACIDSQFFHCLNNIIHTEPENDDELIEDEEEMSVRGLKHHCIYVLAAFCRTRGDYCTEILELILDPKLYNLPSDVRCALTCIQLLSDATVEQPPIGLIFTLMAHMCKVLYRDSEATFGILKVLLNMLNLIWTQDDTLKLNCYIMVKGYLHRCENLFCAPYVVPLVYECGAKIIELNRKYKSNLDNIFQESLVKKLRCGIHSIRLYCCHLLKFVINGFSDEDIDEYLESLSDIYLVDVAETKEEILKDEAANRTLTILHSFVALVYLKKSVLLKVITRIISLQKDKSLDETLVKKVLNKLVYSINKTNIETYLSDNLLHVLHFWFTHNKRVVELPLSLFGCDKLDVFYDKHKKWLIAADSLWNKMGNIVPANVFEDRPALTLEDVVESCFCNIIALCLPHLVIEKYKIDCTLEVPRAFRHVFENANRMFQHTGKILPSDKWTNVFVENVGDLLLLASLHLCDYEGTKTLFQIAIRNDTKSYFYPKKVFCAILDYIGEFTDGNIMQYLCEHQTIVVFQILIRLWENVIKEHVLEQKALALHAYITVVESLPLDYLSDVFVCNFACQSVIHALKKCRDHDEMKLITRTLKFILERFLPSKAELIQKALPEIISVIAVKNDEGFEEQCMELETFVTRSINNCLKESEDVVDYINTMSQGNMEILQCATTAGVMEKLKTFNTSLITPSHKILLKLKKFLKFNKCHVKELCDALGPKGFSEDCKTSIIHRVICSLNNILTSSLDEKITTEACNCLSAIGTYDLKTLVTVPPPDTQKLVTVNPKNYFVFVVIKSLVDIIFDENTKLMDKTLETLHSLMKFVENVDALELNAIDTEILKSLTSSNNFLPIEITFNTRAFDEYYANYSEGIFTATLINMSETTGSSVHQMWLKEITSTLLKFVDTGTDYMKSLQLVCESKSGTCREILPALVGLLLHCSSEKYIEIISQQINGFFHYIWDQFYKDRIDSTGDIFASPKSVEGLNHSHKMIIEYMLAVVDFVRLQRKHYVSRPNKTFENYNYLKLDYDKVAWAATVADQNLAALYYGELWAMSQNAGVPPSSPEFTTNMDGGEQIQQIFRKCYVSIGDMDAIDGCGTAHLTIDEEKRKHLINTGQFADALLLHDIALSSGQHKDPRLQYGVVRSLHKSGMHHLALQYIKSLPQKQELEDIKYECLSFLGDWSEFVDTKELEVKINEPNCNPNSLFKEFHYACLKDCLTLQNSSHMEGKLMQVLNKSKLAIHRLCQNLNMDNCQNTYKVVGKLHLLADIEDFLAVRTEKSSLNDILVKWQVKNLPNYNDFKHLEALISQRALILQHAANMFRESFSEISSLQIEYAELGLSNNKLQMAERVLAMVKKLQKSEEVSLVESEISWAKGHKEIALSLLRNLVCDQTMSAKINAISLRRYGLWMADTKRDNTRDIINKYLIKSLEILQLDDHQETRMKVYYDIAKFADAEYKQVATYMESSIFENKVKCLESMKGTASSLRSTQQELTRDEKKAFFVNDRFRALDEAEIANTKAEKQSYLQLAMRYYLQSLKQCEENNLSVFRVISLWLNNPNFEFEETNNATFSHMLLDIPSRKFITVLPQLAPRISNQKTDFAINLARIIKKCAKEHPHHTLPILFSLKNSDKDKMILNASGSRKTTAKPRNLEPRVVAAETIVKELSQENEELAIIIAQMEKICDATISFANYKPLTKQSKQEIPVAENIRKLSKLNAIPVPTVTIPIQNDCRYMQLPSVHSFDNIFELVGGINCPKKVYCTDSTGKKRILLVKGEDDMRQDAVMQQVFNIVNTLLEKDPITSRNKLLIRTYKVVPMSRQSGVLEWCVGTLPLGAYLVGAGKAGAHARYRPKDITSHAARVKLSECHERRKSNKEKLAVFLKILKDFKPVFHYFFTENYLNPVTWYERRLAYTKSVSTSSMVGYILGLGDRHVHNILIDKSTAEVIHIDFGIAFDQGKTLPTPETVPFRLTQDIIAGFGASGVEGIFRRCCEKTMQLLRNNQETLLTILEVLLCDPLYTWTVTTPHQNARSSENNDANMARGGKSSLAERALLAVSSKLGGSEGGAPGGVAVPGHVARLLQAAADPANLCRLYPGWQPYL